MSRGRSSLPFIFAGVGVLLFSAGMALVTLTRLVWALGGLAVSLVRLAHLSIVARAGK